MLLECLANEMVRRIDPSMRVSHTRTSHHTLPSHRHESQPSNKQNAPLHHVARLLHVGLAPLGALGREAVGRQGEGPRRGGAGDDDGLVGVEGALVVWLVGGCWCCVSFG